MILLSASRCAERWTRRSSGRICSEIVVKPAMSVKKRVSSLVCPPTRASSPVSMSRRTSAAGTYRPKARSPAFIADIACDISHTSLMNERVGMSPASSRRAIRSASCVRSRIGREMFRANIAAKMTAKNRIANEMSAASRRAVFAVPRKTFSGISTTILQSARNEPRRGVKETM